MAEPPNPRDPDPADDVPSRGDPGWVRPSQRRAQKPPSPTPPDEAGAPAGEAPDAATPDLSTPRGQRRRGPDAPAPSGPDVDATEADAEARFPDADEPDDASVDPDLIDTAAPTVAGTAAGAGRGARRRGSHSKRTSHRRAALGAAALVVVLALVAGLVLMGGGGSAKVTAHKHLVAVTTTTAPPSHTSIVATSKVLVLQAFDQPSTSGKVVTTLSAKTDYGLPRTMLVTQVQSGWLQVLLPMKPNDTQAWVQAANVTTSTTDYAIKVELSQHHLWLTKAGAPVLDTAVVIGTPKTPTPTGVFYVTDPVDLRTQPNGPYGAFALGLSGYSNVLPSFDGGPPQIAVHGTPYPDQVGQDLSNGCVRIPSPVIVQIAAVVPLGTPVTINA